MKYPKEINKITLLKTEVVDYFPPVGFLEFKEGNDGAGDYYGLYWQLGKEAEEPIVCLKRHEEWLLEPIFENLSSFLDSYNFKTREFEYYNGFYEKDFFLANYNRAKVKLRKSPNQAKELLKKSISQFDEFSSSWSLLSILAKEDSEKELLEKAAIKSFISNWLFGIPSQKSFEHLESIKFESSFRYDPLIERLKFINFKNNFRAFNISYKEVYNLALDYKEIGNYKSYLLMLQNFARISDSPKKEERIKRGYEYKKWQNEYLEAIENYFPDRTKKYS